MRHIVTLILLLGGLCSTVAMAGGFGIPYEKQPLDQLTVGGQPSLVQLQAISEAGYTTVINLRRAGEFDEFDEAAEVARLGMTYVHIPLRNVAAITAEDARALHEAIGQSGGPVLLHCTVGWRAGGLLAIERYLLHDASRDQALDLAAAAHMDHATRRCRGLDSLQRPVAGRLRLNPFLPVPPPGPVARPG